MLIALGFLALPSNPGHTVTITEVRWSIVQGTTADGTGWFGPSQFNYTDNGWPAQVPSGGRIDIPWSFSNYDASNRTVYAVQSSSPFTVVSSQPALPVSIPGGSDDALIEFEVQVPGGGSLTTALNISIFAR